MEIVQPFWKAVGEFLIKLNKHLLYNLQSHLQRLHSNITAPSVKKKKKKKGVTQTNTSAGEYVNKPWHIHTMELLLREKNNCYIQQYRWTSKHCSGYRGTKVIEMFCIWLWYHYSYTHLPKFTVVQLELIIFYYICVCVRRVFMSQHTRGKRRKPAGLHSLLLPSGPEHHSGRRAGGMHFTHWAISVAHKPASSLNRVYLNKGV